VRSLWVFGRVGSWEMELGMLGVGQGIALWLKLESIFFLEN
jgi:hypothetical protein